MTNFENIRNRRIEEYNNPLKLFLDTLFPGSRKTSDYVGYSAQHNKITLVGIDRHRTMDEIFANIQDSGLYGQINKNINYKVVFGQTFELSLFQQHLYDLPKFTCNILEYPNKTYNRKLYYKDIAILKRNNLLISGFCSPKNCPEYHYCQNKEIQNVALEANNYKKNFICLFPKEYIHGEFMDKLQKEYPDACNIWDEGLYKHTYKQIRFKPWNIENTIDFINDKVMDVDPNIDSEGIWDKIEQIFAKIKSFIKGRKSLKINQKASEITDDLINFIEDFEVRRVEAWIEEVKQLILDYKISVFKINNILNPLVEILDEINKIGEKNEIVKRVHFDIPSLEFSFYKSRMERLQEVVNGFKKNILNDSMAKEITIEHIFPKIHETQDYSILKDDKIESQWEKVLIRNMHHAQQSNRKYSSNPIYELKKKRWKKGEDPYKQKFYDLAKLMIDVLRYEETQERYKVLIGTSLKLEEKLKEFIDLYLKLGNLDIYMDHYYAIESSNLYTLCDYGILFNSAGKPTRVLKAEHSISGLPYDFLNWIAIQGQMLQFMERLRSLLFPYQKRWYVFSNVIRGMFENEVNFECILQYKYAYILDYLAKNGWSTNEGISELTKKNKETTKGILKKLRKEGLIKWKLGRTGGRPLDLWNII